VLLVHHTRERKAGPQIQVTVAQCRTHRRAFTLYPLGHVPYGRLAVAPVTPDGQMAGPAVRRRRRERRFYSASSLSRTPVLGPRCRAYRFPDLLL
jgi:hypothetical protein